MAPASKAASPARAEDPLFAKQWGLIAIKAPQAWRVATGKGALIAILDTGVDLRHPDLKDKLISYKDADFVDPDGKNGAQDEHFHGTHVAGIAAAATANGIGIAGTAPEAMILPVRVLNKYGSGSTEAIASGVRYAADKGADAINMSLGLGSPDGQVLGIAGSLEPLHEAIAYAWDRGAIVVIAGGNSYFPLCAEPAAAPRALCVGATGPDDSKSLFSNFDATMSKAYLVAPGGTGSCKEDILSTWRLAEEETPTCPEGRGYGAIAGTSMAAPFVSGVAALLSGQGLDNQEILDRLLETADDLGPSGRDPMFGYGRLNALRAVSEAT